MQPDWSKCPDVERVPGRMSGVWVVTRTRIPVTALIENCDMGLSADEVSELLEGLDPDRTRRILSFARVHEAHSA